MLVSRHLPNPSVRASRVPGERGLPNSRPDPPGGLGGTRGPTRGPPSAPARGERPGRDTFARDEAAPALPRTERTLPGLPAGTVRTPT